MGPACMHSGFIRADLLTQRFRGELKKGNFMHAKCQFSSGTKHVVKDTIGYTR